MKLVPALFAAALSLAGGLAGCAAEPEPFLPRIVGEIQPFRPDPAMAGKVSGVIRLWGHGNVKLPWMKRLVGLWETGFQRYYPRLSIQYEMHGTSSAIPALYTGVADLAILGEETDPVAAAAFGKVKGYPPLSIDILTGSLDVRNFDYAQMVFVHKDNPVTRLTLAQLDAVYGAEHRRGPGNIRRWGDLGLGGDWEKAAITPYGWAIDDSFGIYLQQALLLGSHRWNCALRSYVHITRPDGTIYDHGQQILDALSRDRTGIAISNIRYGTAQVKAVALAEQDGGPYYQATVENLVLRKYPLTRLIPAVLDRPPGKPVEPKVREFLRYILSREGQQATLTDGRYLPITRETVAASLEKLQ